MLEDKVCYVVLRNDHERQEIRGVFLSEEGAHNCINADIAASTENWQYIDFVIQAMDLEK